MATFILVHGTFATKAHWPALQEALGETANLANDVARFKQLAWTGKNRTSARQVAADGILAMVKKILGDSPSEKIFIIGHSHGGSAVAYFLKAYPEAAKMLVGCAFLSTPFVAIRARTHAIRLVLITMLFSIAAPLLWWVEYNSPKTRDLAVSLADWPAAYWWGVGIVAAVLVPAWRLATRRYRSQDLIDETIRQTIRQQTADIPDGNYLFLRCSGDEAAAALSAAQFTAWLGVKVSNNIEWLFRPLFSKRRLVQGAFSGFLTALFVVGSHFALAMAAELSEIGVFGFLRVIIEHVLAGEVLAFELGLLFLLIVFVIPCAFLLGLILSLFIFVTQAFTSWAFGWTKLAAGFLVELAIEPLPFGQWSLVHINWSANSPGLDGIVHSWTYAHPIAIEYLQDWVRSGFKLTDIDHILPHRHVRP